MVDVHTMITINHFIASGMCNSVAWGRMRHQLVCCRRSRLGVAQSVAVLRTCTRSPFCLTRSTNGGGFSPCASGVGGQGRNRMTGCKSREWLPMLASTAVGARTLMPSLSPGPNSATRLSLAAIARSRLIAAAGRTVQSIHGSSVAGRSFSSGRSRTGQHLAR